MTFIKKILLALPFLTIGFSSFAQPVNVTSDLAIPFCLGITYTSTPAGDNASTLEPGNNYDCLFTQPNPSWYFLKCDQAGSIDLSLSAPQDIDFIIYGPYSNYTDVMNNAGNHSSVVDCSYSATNMETPSIPAMNSGEYFVLLVTNYANTSQNISLTQTGGTGTLDCSVYNEAGLQHYQGTVFYDENSNGTMDNQDFGISTAQVIANPTGAFHYTNSNGDFSGYNQTQDTVDYELTVDLPGWSTTTVSPYQFTLDTANSVIDSVMIGLHPDSAFYGASFQQDAQIFNCVSINQICVSILNTGTLVSQGNITVTIDSLFSYSSSTIPLVSQNGNELHFEYDSLQLLHSTYFCINVLPDTTLMVGDTVHNTVTLTELDSLGNTVNITSNTLCTEVQCSYDPNYKAMITNDITNREFIGPNEEITYIVHFQNTGTANAVNVKIEDSLHTNLDPATFQVMSSSHSVMTTLNNGLIKFEFNDINLPDSTSNEPESHGFVIYKVSPIGGLVPNDQIFNTAYIYFDFNLPIITNTTVNTIDCYTSSPFSGFTLSGNEIQTSISIVDYSFEWFFNGNLMSGEVSNSVVADSSGDYTIVITDQYGCEFSETYNFTSTASIATEITDFSVYPNPSNGVFTINFNGLQVERIDIHDESGRLVYSTNTDGQQTLIIEDELLFEGVYFISLLDADGVFGRERIVKLSSNH